MGPVHANYPPQMMLVAGKQGMDVEKKLIDDQPASRIKHVSAPVSTPISLIRKYGRMPYESFQNHIFSLMQALFPSTIPNN